MKLRVDEIGGAKGMSLIAGHAATTGASYPAAGGSLCLLCLLSRPGRDLSPLGGMDAQRIRHLGDGPHVS